MGKWLTPDLHVKSLSKAGMWQLTMPLEYKYRGEILKVKRGTNTDLASIPLLLKPFFNVNGKSRRSAVLHDDLYTRKWKTRKECDRCFRSAMIDCGVGKFTAWTMYQGVRAGGWTRGRW